MHFVQLRDKQREHVTHVARPRVGHEAEPHGPMAMPARRNL